MMNEYLVTFKGVIPGFFTNRDFTESRAYEADSAKEAMKIATEDVMHELRLKGIYEHELRERGISLTIVDVKKL